MYISVNMISYDAFEKWKNSSLWNRKQNSAYESILRIFGKKQALNKSNVISKYIIKMRL